MGSSAPEGLTAGSPGGAAGGFPSLPKPAGGIASLLGQMATGQIPAFGATRPGSTQPGAASPFSRGHLAQGTRVGNSQLPIGTMPSNSALLRRLMNLRVRRLSQPGALNPYPWR